MAVTIALVVLALVLVVLAIAATRPKELRVQRSARINAAPARIAPHITDFHRWNAWSPWEKLDPAMTKSHSGPASGPGAVYEWEGNRKVGKGRMEILDAAPTRVALKLDFLKPFEAHNTTEFRLDPSGDATDVTWAMYGPSPFVTRVMGVFMNMDRMIGRDFETGLANLKAVAER
jgi:hypothetical protein